MATAQAPRAPETGIKVIIVGTGFAGLTAAIECYRQGHSVLVLESYPELKQLGDIISFGQNSARIFRRWPGVAEAFEPISHRADNLILKHFEGDTLAVQTWDQETRDWGKRYDGHRGEFHKIVFDHAVAQGIEIRLGHKVMEYFETDDGAGVLANGERFTADVVLAADGVRSTGRTLVLGYEDKPQASGYAIYRAWFPSDEIAKDPLTKHFVGQSSDQHICWLGPDVHFIAASLKKGSFSWVCTHKDEADIEESWQWEAPVDDARKVLLGWDPVVQRILDLTPEPLIDWKLVYRDPLPTWISPKRRIALIGDAAHPFLPTSIQGASQAMEDGVTLAICLRKAGKANVQEAVAAFEGLRYNRVFYAQKTGEQTRDTWHNANFDKIRDNPEAMKLKREGWLLNFDAEPFAEANYTATVEVLRRTGLSDTTEARALNMPDMRQ